MSGRPPRRADEALQLKEFGRRISRAMVDAGVRSGTRLAHAVGVSEVSMCAYRLGLQRPSDAVVAKIADALGTTADALGLGAPASFSPDAEAPSSLSQTDIERIAEAVADALAKRLQR